MKLSRIPVIISADETKRSEWTLGVGTRLNPDTHGIELVEPYSMAADLEARTRIFNPQSLKRWIGFDVEIVNTFDPETQADSTGANYKLNDGTTDLYWDGGAWSPAGASDWNTEAEVAANIAAFPVADCKIQVVINPFTLTGVATPHISEIRLLMESDLEELEDLVWRTFLRLLKAEVRPHTDHPIKFAAGGTTIDLNNYPLETPYNITAIDAVFNFDTDPKGQSDIFDSYDSNTKIITLTANLPANTRVWIRILYEPEVAVTTGQEYDELSKVPAIIIRDVNAIAIAEIGRKCAVRNKGAGTAVLITLRHFDIDLVIDCVADKQKDLQRMIRELTQVFENNPLIRSTGLDQDYTLWLVEEYDGRTVSTQSELHTGRLRGRIGKALFFNRPAEDVFAVKRFNLQGDMNTTIGN